MGSEIVLPLLGGAQLTSSTFTLENHLSSDAPGAEPAATTVDTY